MGVEGREVLMGGGSSASSLHVEQLNDFGFNLFHTLIEMGVAGDNLVIAPLSLFFVLAMAQLGVTPASETESEFTNLLFSHLKKHIGGSSAGNFEQEILNMCSSLAAQTQDWSEKRRDAVFSSVNSVWTKHILPSYVESVKGVFLSDNAFDLPPVWDPINKFVKEGTRGLIAKVQDGKMDPDMIAFILNTVYFKGSWVDAFDHTHTREYDFFLEETEKDENRAKIKSLMMCQKMKELNMRSSPSYEAASFPYLSDFEMVIVLPKGNSTCTDWLKSFFVATDDGVSHPSSEKSDYFDVEKFSLFFRDGWRKQRDVRVRLPKFKIESEVGEITSALKKMGFKTAFGPVPLNKFERMSSDPTAHISKVIHKTVLDVNEEGTEAAAMSGVVVMTRMAVKDPLVFYVDRPFLIFIWEKKSGIILFSGHIKIPSGGIKKNLDNSSAPEVSGSEDRGGMKVEF